jgi:crotonobetainyl-CoA:carnitine CoA-transferase CaiB-like acyl-CoA transferase
VEAPDLAADPRYLTNADRVRHRGQVLREVSARLADGTCDEWVARFSRAGIPCAPILSVGEVLAHPHTEASGMIRHLAGDAGKDGVNVVSQPLRFDGKRSVPSAAPPALGAHTRTVLQALGYSEEQIGLLAMTASN